MKLLIVDDEPISRLGIILSVDWQTHGYEVVGEASNGEIALEMIQTLHPDIVLLDITMPVMSGLEVLKYIQTHNIPCTTLVLSCHSEFDYVKQALKLGAHDYFLKNRLTKENILETINGVRDWILSQNVSKSLPTSLSIDTSDKNQMLRNILKGMSSSHTLDEILNLLDLNVTSKNFHLIAIQTDTYKSNLSTSNQQNFIPLHQQVLSVLTQALLDEHEVELIDINQNDFCLLVSHKMLNSSTTIHQRHIHLLSTLQEACHLTLGITLNFACSLPLNLDDNVYEIYKNTILLFSQKFLKPSCHTFFASHYRHNTDEVDTILNFYSNAIRSSTCLESTKTISDELLNMQKKLSTNLFIPIDQLYTSLNTILFYIAKHFELSFEELLNQVAHAKHLSAWCSALQETINQLTTSTNITSNQNYIVNQALQFISEQYLNPIRLNDIAQALDISPSYLSRLFNKQIGYSIPIYINNKRIEKAKELLKTTTMKNYEIAEYVGFSTPVHFDMVFKKLTNTTPSYYRNN